MNSLAKSVVRDKNRKRHCLCKRGLKSFITFVPIIDKMSLPLRVFLFDEDVAAGGDGIKLFPPSPTAVTNKLERLSLTNFYSQV